jgi:hypothetical protein
VTEAISLIYIHLKLHQRWLFSEKEGPVPTPDRSGFHPDYNDGIVL